MFLSRLILTAASVLVTVPAVAHEFWIEPHRYQVASGENLQADFKNGEAFKGNTMSFFDRNSVRFEMVAGDSVTTLLPRAGDLPALDVAAPVADGLVIVIHETTPSQLTYREWEKFLRFADHKDFPNAAADHLAAGWPQDKFKESYTRHAKALIAVGDGKGADRDMGLETEFVSLTNPYSETFTNNMKVLLTHRGKPRADAQVEVFERSPEGVVTITLHRTDAAGLATVPVKAGHSYLLDAVVLRPFSGPAETADGPVWETLWAALTFMVPQ